MAKKVHQLRLTDKVLAPGDVKNYGGKLPITVDDATGEIGISLDKAAAADRKIVHSLNLGEIVSYLGGTMNNVTEVKVHPGPAIEAGATDPETGLTYAEAVPEQYVQQVHVFSTKPQADCDIEVDWGDGTVSTLSAMPLTDNVAEGLHYVQQDDEAPYCWRMELAHTYAAEGRFSLKVSGDDIWCVRFWGKKAGAYNNAAGNLVSGFVRLGDSLVNASSMFGNANRLLKVDATAIDWLAHPLHLDRCNTMFTTCKNLVEVVGMEHFLESVSHSLTLPGGGANGMFISCSALTTCAIRLPVDIADPAANCFGEMFMGCVNLATPIEQILPAAPFAVVPKLNGMFWSCASINGTIPANVLWDDTSKDWTSALVGGMFGPASAPRPSDEFCAQIPATAFPGDATKTWRQVLAGRS